MSARTDGKGNLSYSKLNDELTKEFGAKGTGYTISDEDAEIWAIKVGNVEYNIENSTHITSNTPQKLVDIVAPGDYGKSIDYSVTVNETTLNNWKVFLNDGNNVYIILSDYLTGSLLPNFGFPVEISNNAYTLMYECDGSPEDITDKLANTNYFSDFASGEGAVSATGGPSKEQLDASYGSEVHIGDYLDGSLYTIRK